MEFTLSAEEHQLIMRILEQRHQLLLKEIWHTDHRQFKLALQEDEKLLESILNRLHEAPLQQPRL
jgi:hypothetical protein